LGIKGVTCAILLDDNAFYTGSIDSTLKKWDIASGECLDSSYIGSSVVCLTRTKDKSKVVFGNSDGSTEFRTKEELKILSTLFIHSDPVYCICQLEDGSFVSGSYKELSRWSENGTVLQTFNHSQRQRVRQVIGMNGGAVIVSAADDILKVWDVATGELLCTLSDHGNEVVGLIKLSEDMFISGSRDKTMRVWYENKCIETIHTEEAILAMTRLGDFIVTDHTGRLEVRRLK